MAMTGYRTWTWVLTCALCASQPVHVLRAEESEPVSPGRHHHHHSPHARKVTAPAPRPLAIPPPVVESEPPPVYSRPPPLQAKRGAWYGPAYVTVSAPRVTTEQQQGPADAPPPEPPAPRDPERQPDRQPARLPERQPERQPDRLPEPPVVGAGGTIQRQVDLSRLPEVEDRPLERSALLPGDVRLPLGYSPPRRSELPYLNEMSADPELRFVPESPSTSLNPRLAWDDMMAPPPPTPAEVEARRLRNMGIGLLVGGLVAFLVSVPMMVEGVDLTATKGIGYGLCGLSLGTLAAGGAVLGVGEHRLRLARRAATGVASLPGPRLLLGRGLALEF